jgi:hypothetical protein
MLERAMKENKSILSLNKRVSLCDSQEPECKKLLEVQWICWVCVINECCL